MFYSKFSLFSPVVPIGGKSSSNSAQKMAVYRRLCARAAHYFLCQFQDPIAPRVSWGRRDGVMKGARGGGGGIEQVIYSFGSRIDLHIWQPY